MKKKLIILLFPFLIYSCVDTNISEEKMESIVGDKYWGDMNPPILNSLSTGTIDKNSIGLNQPTFTITGKPTPTVEAYIGLDGVITTSGNIITNYFLGPLDVSANSCLFNLLNVYTGYRIIVVAENSMGYSIKEITQTTSGIEPKLAPLSILNYDSTSITIEEPSFTDTGAPDPTVNAYIGLNGTISISGNIVSNAIAKTNIFI